MRNKRACMNRFLALAFLAMPACAGTSLSVTSGHFITLTVPAVAPFTAFGDYRVEFRLHSWTVPGSGSVVLVSFGSGAGKRLEIALKSTAELCATNWVDGTGSGITSCANLTSHSDVIVRVQRFANGTATSTGWQTSSFSLEAQDINGTAIAAYCGSAANLYECPMTAAVSSSNWAQTTGYIGSSTSAFSLAWLKWSSVTVPPGSLFSQESTPADLADWRFENSLTNIGTGAYTIALASSSPRYAPSPGGSPVCIAGVQQSFRAGYPTQLDGTYAYSPNSSAPLTYLWQQLSGPTHVVFDSRNTAAPTVGRTAFGSYVFQLTVTDASGQSSSCNVKHGFVATDANDVVITDNAVVDTLLGSMIRYGASPWPWMDNRHKAGAQFNIGHLTDYFTNYWLDSKQTGTVTVTSGSATVTGYNTSFTTTFCQGPGNPTAPKTVAGGQNVYILVWHPMTSPAAYDGLPENTGLRFEPVQSCQSDTQLTITENWPTWIPDCSGGGCSYSYDDASLNTTVSPAADGYSGVYQYPEHAGSNFYDAVAAFYALYYRSGIDDYLTAARTLADRDWKYRLGSGLECHYGSQDRCGAGLAPRTQSTLGMVLRAFDGRPDMWPGLKNIFDYHRQVIHSSVYYYHSVSDLREAAYETAILSYCSLYYPSAYDSDGTKAACKAELSYDIANMWSLKQVGDGSWPTAYTPYMGNSWYQSKSVYLTNGSTGVDGSGSGISFGAISTGDGTWTAHPSSTEHIVFFTGTAQPANNAATENVFYTASYSAGADSHLTLDRPYAGTTGNHGWMVGYGFCPNDCFVGYGTQPFMLGILGFAFEMASQAIAVSDPTNAAKARQYVADIANWEMNYGYRPATKGMYYLVDTVDCPPPIDELWTWCGTSETRTVSRALNPESLRSVMLAYRDTGSAALLTFGDTLYSAMWAKPGTCPSGSVVCTSDGYYLDDWDNWTGWYVSGTNVQDRWHKYFGMSFGIGAGSDWPAVRVGGPQSPGQRLVYMAFNMRSVSGAASVRVVTTAPSGEVFQTPCASSPCAVSIDSRQGDHILWLEYLSSNGAVLASTELPLIQGH
jgi:hypothetical protein